MERAIWSYWQRVHKKALIATCHTLGLQSWGQVMLRALAAIAIVAGLALWGSDDAASDELIFRGIGIGFVIALFPLVYAWNFLRTPQAMEQDLSRRLIELEESRRPILEFDFRFEDNKFLEPDFILDGEISGNIGRVAVKNISSNVSVIGASATLINYSEDGNIFYTTVDIPLTSYSTGKTLEDIAPRRSVTYDLFRVQRGKSGCIDLGPRPDGSFKRIPAGRYRIKVTASSSNTPSLSGLFLIELSQNGDIEYGIWKGAGELIK